jgi:predicted ATPase/DNA-binding SARP family transcriptional activator
MSEALPKFELRTLGALTLTDPAGGHVDAVASGPRRIAMLTYLALRTRGGMERRDILVDVFWPESSSHAARHSLRSLLHTLRKMIPGVIITRGDEEIGIDREHLFCDVVEFEQAIQAARYADAVELYAGEFLTGFHLRGAPGFGEWAESVRAQSGESVVEAASYLARAGLDAGDSTALARARRAMELSGGREPQVRLLIEALAMAGDTIGALREYEALSYRLREDYGVQPSVETESLVHLFARSGTGGVAVSSDGGPPPPSRPRSLPAPATPFIGREQEIAATAARLGESRLVTILGPGGVGKTRLALEVSGRLREAYRDGVWFVPLGGLSSGEHLASTVGATLRVPAAPATSTRSRLFDYLAEKEMLLVLDSFEHLAAEGSFISQILEAAPEVRLLVTSRERLGVPAETLVELWGMEVPDGAPNHAWREAEAVRLFVQAARRVEPGFAVMVEDLPDVARICRFAGGFPLGIELAAAWTRLLSAREVAAELEAGSEPAGTAGGLPERQRSLRAAFGHSWALLPEREQSVLARLSIFRGPFRVLAATAVAGATLPALSLLADRSLVRRVEPGSFEVPEVLRRYAEEKLRESAFEHDRAAERHATYYLRLLAGAESVLASIEERTAAARLQPEIDQIRAAWMYAVHAGLSELIEASARALFLVEFERAGNQDRAAFAAHRLGTTWCEAGRPDDSRKMFERSVRRYRELGDRRAMANSIMHMGMVAFRQGRYDESRGFFEEAISIQRSLDDRRLLSLSLNNLGCLVVETGHSDEGVRCLREGLRLAAGVGDSFSAVWLLNNLGRMAERDGDLSEASAFAERSLELARRMGFRLVQAWTFLLLGDVSIARHENADAEKHFQSAMSCLAGSGAVPMLLEVKAAFAELENARGNIGKAKALAAEALLDPMAPAALKTRVRSLLSQIEQGRGDDAPTTAD